MGPLSRKGATGKNGKAASPTNPTAAISAEPIHQKPLRAQGDGKCSKKKIAHSPTHNGTLCPTGDPEVQVQRFLNHRV
jgi:hypothetical protein